jgi:hypothetical protein
MITTRSTLKVLQATVVAPEAIIITAAAALLTPVASASPISGSLDDWEGAVCAIGTVVRGRTNIFPNAVAGDSCVSKNYSGAIQIAQWNDNFLMINHITLWRGGSYVSAKKDQTIIDLVAPNPGRAADLQPLTQFGFTVQTIAAQG